MLCRLPATDLAAMARLAAAPRFSEALCAALLGAERGQAVLGRLKRDDLFLTLEAPREPRAARQIAPVRTSMLKRSGDIPSQSM